MTTHTKQDAVRLLDVFDPEMAGLLHREERRQFETIGLIASENVVSPMAACLEGSVFTNKNTEGYTGKRFVGGCELADQAEQLAVKRVKQAFGVDHANIQCGNATIANIAVLRALLKPGDTFLGLALDNGGHLSHGAKFHYSGATYHALHYGVSRETERIDMDQVRQMAREHHPKLICVGSSSYPRLIDYKAFREICDEVGAYFWVDCAHDCGLIAGGAIPSPVPYAHVLTFSTQKTLRGPRGCGVILVCRDMEIPDGVTKDGAPKFTKLSTKIDRSVFPRLQGGPKGDMLAARGVLFYELLQPEFKEYARQVCRNAKALARGCAGEGMRLITGGTDTHMVMIDVTPLGVNGQEAETLLNRVGMVTNKNMIPFDPLPPSCGSGLRIGSPTMTTRGAKEEEMEHIGHLLGRALKGREDPAALERIAAEVKGLATSHPMFSGEWVSPCIREQFEAMYGLPGRD